jgi:phage-related protein
MVSAAGSFFAGIGTALAEKASEVLTNIKAKVAEWVNAVKEKVNDWKTAGQNLIAGLWSGISDKAQWLYSQITGMGSTIVSKVKSLFGIASPSKVFAEIGGYLAEGLGEGWNEEIQNVRNDIDSDLNFKGSIDTTAVTSSPVSTLNGATIELHDYINLGDTELKEVVSKYTIQQIDNETRATVVAQGGFYGI